MFVKLTVLVVGFAVLSGSVGAQYQQHRVDDSRNAKITQMENNFGNDKYNFAYQTSDGTSRQESAELKNLGGKDEALVVQGTYTFVGTDGITYKVTYIADENGYRATGEHLPKNN